MEGLIISIPTKRGRPCKSTKSKMNLKKLETPRTSKRSLRSLQSQHKNDFKLEKLKSSTWQYVVSNGLKDSIFDNNMLELLLVVTDEFMMSEIEYIAVISLLQQKNVILLKFPSCMLLDLSCYLVKFYLETNKEIVELLHQKLSEQYSNFEEMLEKIKSVSKIQIKDLNKIYGDFQRIMTQQCNYCVLVGDIVKGCTFYNKKNKLTMTQLEGIFKKDNEIDENSDISELDYKPTDFWNLEPVDKLKSKDKAADTKKIFLKCESFLNDEEFENGFYVADEFESIA